MIKTVIFDLGGVIVPLDFRRGYEALQGLSPYRAEEIPARIAATGLVPRLEKGLIEPEEFAARISEALDLGVSFEEFCRIWSAIFPPHTLIPESLLESLRGRHRLLLLSNTNAIHFPFIRNHYPLLRHFDDFVLSYQVGAMKPAPEIYREAVARSGCAPRECFFIDDVAENVEAARREGLDAARFVSYEQLRDELRARQIDV
jgi:putative hydrolase of the HAD superfamily